jgi:ADP-heptose:LPS heptosyltransferase
LSHKSIKYEYKRKKCHRNRWRKRIGKAVALALANEGVNVIITGRNEENLKNTVEEIQN